MSDGRTQHTIEVAGHVLSRGPLRVEGSQLVVMFTVAGPDASPRFPKLHVNVIRSRDAEKLVSRGGHGGFDDDGRAFFEWRLDWPGGDEVRILYFEEPDHIVHSEVVTL